MGTILNLISSRGFIAVNKKLAKIYGLDEAIMLGELASEYEYWETRGEIEDGYFYSTVDNVQENTMLSDRRQRAAIKTLQEAGVLHMKLKGLPKKRYFMIDEYRIMEELNLSNVQNNTLQNARFGDCKMQDMNLAERQTNNNNHNNNNKENKKESKRAALQSFESVIDNYTENMDLREALRGYVQMRKAIRKPITNRALELAFGKLDDLAHNDFEKIGIVNQSVMNSWQGLFPLKDNRNGGGYRAQETPHTWDNLPGMELI